MRKIEEIKNTELNNSTLPDVVFKPHRFGMFIIFCYFTGVGGGVSISNPLIGIPIIVLAAIGVLYFYSKREVF